MPVFEFHISAAIRQRANLDDSIFATSGNALLSNLSAAQRLAENLNTIRPSERPARAGEIYAMGLIDEILHRVARLYRMQVNPWALEKALAWLEERLGAQVVASTLNRFCTDFPPLAVYGGEISVTAYLSGRSDGLPNRQIALEELLMLYLANANPAFRPYAELFDDSDLDEQTAYSEIIAQLEAFFTTQPPFGPQKQSLFQMLRAPSLAADTLAGQLEFIRQHWGPLLGDWLDELLRALDYLQEENKPAFPPGPGPLEVPQFHLEDEVPEHFSPDRDWMPGLVLIAKNTCVWLHQLSRQYRRQVHRLDQIPDEELDKLASWGINGLWLIGVWERSPASRRIKRLCGNPDAIASAYSLYDYVIAAELGGEEALNNLRRRAARRGIRLAADMVPNHMGIDSRWVIEHPDWFIATDQPPYPQYTFNGENLSSDPRVGIYLEDHYYDKSDAAVVFRRTDHQTNQTIYIYHGNDGTSMPWNDTAQLNFLKPEVREAVMQTILHVARQFPIIRFDAAMTLTKKHYQRLWFPEPGSGGAIPSRARFGMRRAEFDQAMPQEFWRQVVDRVAAEAPDTLLLAEAFWMMEGYFVRTLGMHRVYNSAFMHMLRDEKNAAFRKLIKDTLEYNPQILKRYVNFMNNPDEETAIEQFGDGGKYFGVCTLMVTLPGLPMFGHGQIEGYREKYGMEYRRPQWEEYPDTRLIARHEREIFPLTRRRRQFAEVEHFRLYDFYTADGRVDENVITYSNNVGGQRSLVAYHNRWADTRGWVRLSAAFRLTSDEPLRQETLAEALGLRDDSHTYTLFRDHVSGLEYIRNNRDLHQNGLYLELGAYHYHVFLDFRQVSDAPEGPYARLCAELNGSGVPNIAEALQERVLDPLLAPWRSLLDLRLLDCPAAERRRCLRTLEIKLQAFYAACARQVNRSEAQAAPGSEVARRVLRLWELYSGQDEFIAAGILPTADEDPAFWAPLTAWLFLAPLEVVTGLPPRGLLDDWLLGKVYSQKMQPLLPPLQGAQARRALAALLATPQWWENPMAALTTWFQDIAVQQLLGCNTYQGVRYFHKESFERLLRWALAAAAIEIAATPRRHRKTKQRLLHQAHRQIPAWQRAAEACGYRVEEMLKPT